MVLENDRKELLKNALLAIDEMQGRLDAAEQAKREPIAVVGMSCRFPGGANSPELYWQLLRNGADLVGPVPQNRWSTAVIQRADIDPERPISSWQGGFLDQIDEFDAQFFGIIPREVITMDPQQRLVLEVAWEALERAGIAPDGLNGSLTGVFIGITTSDYASLTRSVDPDELDFYVATGSALNVVPGRLAYTLGLQGPSMAIDTACSSSLVAIHLACQSLRNGESNLAIAGGVNALVSPDAFLVFNKWGMMASDGRCKTFDTRADGFVRSEGCGIIILKRLSDALNDGDHILGLIRGSAVNQDGRSTGLTAPNGLAQQQVIRAALNNAGAAPQDISYVEAHGTGTSLGDPIEVEAIGAVLKEGRTADRPLMMGSVKTNIGHAESAAGVAGVIKTILALQHGELPPNLHLTERNPGIPWPDFPVEIPTEPTVWEGYDGVQLAGVSAFGFSGTNAHIILEAPPKQSSQEGIERPYHVLTLSARNEEALLESASRLGDFLLTYPETQLGDAAYTANSGRARFSHRLALTASTTEEAAAKLQGFVNGEDVPGVTLGLARTERQRVVFLFTGQGSQYWGMGQMLYETQPTFRAALDTCDAILRQYLPDGLLSVLFSEEDTNAVLQNTAYTQPALFAIEYALAQLWMSWGIQPHAVLGHSVGEFTAACIAGVFSLEDGLRLIAERGRLMGALPAGGVMAAAMADENTVAEIIQPFGEAVVIATLNGPENTVISGQEAAVQAAAEALNSQGIKTRLLNVSHAFHSALMEPMLPEFERVLNDVKFAAPRLRLAANVTGTFATQELTRPDYWLKQARGAVRFSDGIQALYDAGYRTFLEIGPNPTLISMGQRIVPEGNWLPSLREKRNDWEVILGSVGRLFTSGIDIDWEGFDRDYPHQKVLLPTYPFQRQRYWMEVPERDEKSSRLKKGSHPLLGSRYDLPSILEIDLWENEVSLERQAYLGDHQVQELPIVPATAYIEMSIAAAVQRFAPLPLSLEQVQNLKPLYLNPGEKHQVQLVLRPGDGEAAYEVHSRPITQPENEDWTHHVSGMIYPLSEATPPTLLEQFDPEAIIARCRNELAGSAFYERLAEKGNQWGPAFQGIEQLWGGSGEALSRVRVPDVISGQIDSYLFHPAVSDACGHVLTATISMERSDDQRGGAFVGAGVDATRVYKPLRGDTFWCYARLRGDSDQENLLVGDVAVYDEQYQLVSETIGARLWYLDAQQSEAQKIGNWLYEIEWKPVEAALNGTGNAGSWLIFADQSQGVGASMAERSRLKGENSVLVYAGDGFERVSENEFRMRPGSQEDMALLFSHQPALPYDGILFLWGLDAVHSDHLTMEELYTQQTLGSESVLCLVKGLLASDWDEKPRLWLVTSGAVAVETAEAVSVAQSPLWGLGKTFALEQSGIWGGLIDLDPQADAEQAAGQLLQSLAMADGEDQIALRAGSRYAARLARHRHIPQREVEVKADASYLITGGLGGLGLEVGKWLAEKGACHVILMGRTPLPPRDQWETLDPNSGVGRRVTAVQQIESLGARVTVAAIDVSDADAMREFLNQYAADGSPPVRGIVHAAGIMQYAIIQDHAVADMRGIYAPKVAGSWLLHSLFADAGLDFFVTFSSTSALLSSPLMCSYAAANTFMDALAHYRRARGLPALSINWGTWREAGMAVAVDAPNRSMDELQSISNREGLAALEQLLAGDGGQVAVMPVDWARWQKQFRSLESAPFLSLVIQPKQKQSRSRAGSTNTKTAKKMLLEAGPDERPQLAENYIGGVVSRVTGLSQADLDMSQSLTNLGMDSLIAVELRNTIQTDLNVAVPMPYLLGGPSATALTQKVLELMAATSGGAASGESTIEAQSPEVLLDQLDGLSEAEIDALLANLLTDEE